MNTFSKTYYWLILTGIASGVLTSLIFVELISSKTWYGVLFALITPGVFLTMFNSFVLAETNPPKRNLYLITLFGGLLTFLVYLWAILIAWLLMSSLKANEHFAAGLIGLVTSMMAQHFFNVQFKLRRNKWTLTAFALTGFCSGLILMVLGEQNDGFFGYGWLNNIPTGILIGYTLFTLLFNVCIILSAFTKHIKVLHLTYFVILFMLTTDIFLHLYF